MSAQLLSSQSRPRAVARWVLAAAYAAAGVLHLAQPAPFLSITPAWVPFAPAVVAFTGCCELAGAVGLLVPRTRWAAGVGLALYALCVWPANFQHALGDLPSSAASAGWGYHAPRLLLQPVIIWWALWAGGVTDWPFRRRTSP